MQEERKNGGNGGGEGGRGEPQFPTPGVGGPYDEPTPGGGPIPGPMEGQGEMAPEPEPAAPQPRRGYAAIFSLRVAVITATRSQDSTLEAVARHRRAPRARYFAPWRGRRARDPARAARELAVLRQVRLEQSALHRLLIRVLRDVHGL